MVLFSWVTYPFVALIDMGGIHEFYAIPTVFVILSRRVYVLYSCEKNTGGTRRALGLAPRKGWNCSKASKCCEWTTTEKPCTLRPSLVKGKHLLLHRVVVLLRLVVLLLRLLVRVLVPLLVLTLLLLGVLVACKQTSSS